jgi:hypothetical protein
MEDPMSSEQNTNPEPERAQYESIVADLIQAVPNGTLVPHPYALMLPALTDEEYAALKEDIREHGILYPVIVDEDWKILDGVHRVRIAGELGIEPPVSRHEGLTEQRKLHLAVGLNTRRRHMDAERRRELVRRLWAWHRLSVRQIAAATGWSKSTVGRDLAPDAPISAPLPTVPSGTPAEDDVMVPITVAEVAHHPDVEAALHKWAEDLDGIPDELNDIQTYFLVWRGTDPEHREVLRRQAEAHAAMCRKDPRFAKTEKPFRLADLRHIASHLLAGPADRTREQANAAIVQALADEPRKEDER